MFRILRCGLLVLISGLLVPSNCYGGLIIQVNFTGDAQYAPAFATAAATWQNLLIGNQNGLVVDRTAGSSYQNGQTVTTVFINASVVAIDGAGGILGSAGPDELVQDSNGFTLATDGSMNFDIADVASLLANGTWEPVILHEMAHVLGFGTLWNENGVYVNGTGEFTGANATAFWHSEFGQAGTPDVELEGGPGTANGHWNEGLVGGVTGIQDSLGRDMNLELMTGWLNPNSFISDMTVASFRDIGFVTVIGVPEPSSMLLFSLSVGVAGFVRHRRQRKA